MNALEITKTLKANRRSVLWVNDDRREAAYHSGTGSYCVPVDYSAATVAKTDPAFVVVEKIDGTTYAAA
jgi:hypothetical protein